QRAGGMESRIPQRAGDRIRDLPVHCRFAARQTNRSLHRGPMMNEHGFEGPIHLPRRSRVIALLGVASALLVLGTLAGSCGKKSTTGPPSQDLLPPSVIETF